MTASSPSDEQQRASHHARSAKEVLADFDVTRAAGLSAEEAAARLERFGRNALPAPRRRGPFLRFLLQFHNVLIYVLVAAGVVTALLGHWIDSGVIFGVVLINAIIGFIQEGKAEQALDAIRKMLSLRAQVVRGGHRKEIPAEEVVPGDIVFLASGDKVPADLRLIEVRSLRVEEAALTGESVPVEKNIDAVAEDAALGDRAAMAYSGTLVAYGQAVGVAVATGSATEIGRISAMLGKVEELTTPLLRQLGVFGRWLTWAILAIAGIAFAFGTLVRDYTADEMFLAAVGLAVAAIPEGLPAIMTITLAIGVQRMARRNAIIRRLPSVEALGSVTVICSDKTGTLTRNEMTAQRVVTAADRFAVSGVGYAPHGAFSRQATGGASGSQSFLLRVLFGADLLEDDRVGATVASEPGEVSIEGEPVLLEAARAALLCNDASIREESGEWCLRGDPTEGALVTVALKAGLETEFECESLPRTDVIPFESEHRFMATLHHDHQGRGRVYLKGAPERVFELCTRQRLSDGDAPIDKPRWQAAMDDVAAEGMRLLAVAVREGEDGLKALTFDDVERGGFTLLAVFGLSDPPREEAIEAVARCLSAGIRVKMITGDHVATAKAIGIQLGLAREIRAVTGAQIEQMDDAAIAAMVLDTQIFARASPEHKLRLVTALQSRGEVVAMTGDGVNDAPALKRADVGVAMGHKGTEAAKEASEMVLADDNFASVTAAVEEGRTVYDNIKKAIVFILPTNIGQAGIVFFAILFGMTMPITPAQILWVNMITAVTLALALAFELPERNIMQRPPRSPSEPILGPFLIWRVVFVGVLLVAGGMGFFVWELERGETLEVARTAAVNAVLVGEAFYLFNVRSFTDPVLNRSGLTGNRYILAAIALLVLAQAVFTYLPVMQTLFGTEGLDLAAWLRIVAFGIIVLLLVEAEKALVRRMGPAKPARPERS
ncbi:MAG TPA: cation-transporting P-type ATPase [Rhodocyclaceae bacterium]|nr:cation-transporting P-type ATPase [Rhodocyclaceae bacterium]HRQ45705.1 cation-transporting P-type ATPase [Rhodocyclaceae bacterium]